MSTGSYRYVLTRGVVCRHRLVFINVSISSTADSRSVLSPSSLDFGDHLLIRTIGRLIVWFLCCANFSLIVVRKRHCITYFFFVVLGGEIPWEIVCTQSPMEREICSDEEKIRLNNQHVPLGVCVSVWSKLNGPMKYQREMRKRGEQKRHHKNITAREKIWGELVRWARRFCRCVAVDPPLGGRTSSNTESLYKRARRDFLEKARRPIRIRGERERGKREEAKQ